MLGGFGGFGRITHSLVEVHGGACVCMVLGHFNVAVASGRAVVGFKLARLLFRRLNMHMKSYV